MFCCHICGQIMKLHPKWGGFENNLLGCALCNPTSDLKEVATVHALELCSDIRSGTEYFSKEEGCILDNGLQMGKYSGEALAQLLKLVESRDRGLIFDDLFQLMPWLDLTEDSSQFTCFYDFVFFMCRENGQKNISVSRAVAAWRSVLAGRFRLLNQWCDFVEKNQQHNISEDTWRQVLAFSRCVHEDLEGYEPEGAWPVLIDDFVEHMYRITRSNSCCTLNFGCNCADLEAQPCISNDSLPGLRIFSGSKRKSLMDVDTLEMESSNTFFSDSVNSNTVLNSMSWQTYDRPENWEHNPLGNATGGFMEIVKTNGQLGSSNSLPCAVEGSLSKGFAGLLSTGPCLQFNQKRRACDLGAHSSWERYR
ncbi:hypothetical protein HHK36_029795 [Tetracentron sinense]|uniref:Defective in cullin neddylation protein n=1 Tax=Tetracentron sinense TaxID=13715 RepID=A0A834YDL9_TETSI|nr:hypothetical protein HHK36_029795 [Tetracentron sinense]